MGVFVERGIMKTSATPGDTVLGVFSDCASDKKRSNQARWDSSHARDSKQLFAGGTCRVNLAQAFPPGRRRVPLVHRKKAAANGALRWRALWRGSRKCVNNSNECSCRLPCLGIVRNADFLSSLGKRSKVRSLAPPVAGVENFQRRHRRLLDAALGNCRRC